VIEIHTKRLCLRPFRADDLPAFVAYRSAAEVARYQSWEPSYGMGDAERFLASQQGVDLWPDLSRNGLELAGNRTLRLAVAAAEPPQNRRIQGYGSPGSHPGGRRFESG
jgi:GNAT acetyltransferase-like protein